MQDHVLVALSDPDVPHARFLRALNYATPEEVRCAQVMMAAEIKGLLDLRAGLVARRDQLLAKYPGLADDDG